MFAFLHVPGIQQKLQVILNNTLNRAQITFSKSAFTPNPNRVEPEFCFISFFVT